MGIDLLDELDGDDGNECGDEKMSNESWDEGSSIWLDTW